MSTAGNVTTKVFMVPYATDGACSEQEVGQRDPAKHAAEWGQKGYAVSFGYYEQDVVSVGDKEFKADKRYDEGHYYLGTMRSVEDQAALIDNDWMRDNFKFNVEQTGAKFVAVAPNGRTSMLKPGDYVVSLKGVVSKVMDTPASEALKV